MITRGRRAASVDALQTVLRAEHAAVYGYGVVGARLRGSLRESARTLWNAHRTRRDELAARITGLGAEPAAAAPAYRLPVQVASARGAAQVAAALEDDLVVSYTGLAGSADAALRTFAAQAMQEAMARAVRWHSLSGRPVKEPSAGPSVPGPPRTSAFPGLSAGALVPRPRPGD
ncbi:ferritin-like domain-containing protein [Actinomadura rugatobispora]|uniref:Ferritin-like domain-containing protein n=1 Tax=Actinomadura rugatobispora TaxID=1994 RepID=A0ABW1AJT2_9ACTN|nr:ferritin-like domain-containing protein [Actinomadura rugatobispora]